MRNLYLALGAGLLLLGLAGCGGGGGGGGSSASPTQAHAAPTAAVLVSGQVATQATAPNLVTNVGADITLSGAGSSDPDGESLSFQWTLNSRPAGSSASLSNATSAIAGFKPDALGTYAFTLRVTDSQGAYAEKSVSIAVNNSAPNTSVLVTATFTPTPTTAPTQPVTIGASVVLDASGTTDPQGNPFTVGWTLVQKPAGSSATLTTAPLNARFVADVAGTYQVQVSATDSQGAATQTTYVFSAQNTPPNAVLVATAIPIQAVSGQSLLTASVGYDVLFDGSSSSDPNGDTLTRSWSLLSKPSASAASLTASSGLTTQLSPDVLGNYVIQLTVADPYGASAIYTTTLIVNNTRPTAVVSTNSTPTATASAPSIRIPVNTAVALRGGASFDPDGGSMTYAWSIVSAPANSTAALANPDQVDSRITPDLGGTYAVKLRVTDPAGAFSESTVTITAGDYPPVALIDKSRVSVVAGTSVAASAAMSYDSNGYPLTYQWAIDASPAGSSATIAAPGSSALSFTPDVPGTYILSLTVNNGQASSIAYLTIRALASLASAVALDFIPLDAKYSRGLDKMVVVAAAPDALKIVDPFAGTIQTVLLPFAVKSMQLSPDGKLAAVLHEGAVSLVDLSSAQLVHANLTGGSQTDLFVQNDAVAYLIGQTGGQWVSPAVSIFDLRTGLAIPATNPVSNGFAYFYGTQKGVFADKINKVLFMAYGLSPSDISFFTVNQATHALLTSGDSIYHGTWPLGTDFYLSRNQDMLFTSYGNFFYTDTLLYGGLLTGMPAPIISMSQSAPADELLVLTQQVLSYYPTVADYSSSYKRYYGPLFQPDADIPLPLVAGQQSYGIKLFHSANENHVILVQTGNSRALAAGVQYFVISR